MRQPQSNETSLPNWDPSRRGFFQRVAGMTAGLALTATASPDSPAAGAEAPTSAPPLPTVALGPHKVTPLIIGGNPIYGHSDFNQLALSTRFWPQAAQTCPRQAFARHFSSPSAASNARMR
jgi:hypothetical protein